MEQPKIAKRAFILKSQQNTNMSVIGITGGIASGKSTFCRMLAHRMDAEIFDADAEARMLLERDIEVRKAVIREISSAAYDENGEPDRAEIRRVIFADPCAKARLEEILHPRVRERWMARAAEKRETGRQLLVDIPLLFENHLESHFSLVITVACSRETQIQRVVARGIESQVAEKILAAQTPTLEKISRANFVVWNDGCLEALESQADELVKRGRLDLHQVLPPQL